VSRVPVSFNRDADNVAHRGMAQCAPAAPVQPVIQFGAMNYGVVDTLLHLQAVTIGDERQILLQEPDRNWPLAIHGRRRQE
jgi:hypothetical protein